MFGISGLSSELEFAGPPLVDNFDGFITTRTLVLRKIPRDLVSAGLKNQTRLSGQFSTHQLLEQSEQLEDDHNNDNYSDYIEDVSVHAGDSYQSKCAVASIYPD